MKLYLLQILIGKWETCKINWKLFTSDWLMTSRFKNEAGHVVKVCDFKERKIYICLTEILKKIVTIKICTVKYVLSKL